MTERREISGEIKIKTHYSMRLFIKNINYNSYFVLDLKGYDCMVVLWLLYFLEDVN